MYLQKKARQRATKRKNCSKYHECFEGGLTSLTTENKTEIVTDKNLMVKLLVYSFFKHRIFIKQKEMYFINFNLIVIIIDKPTIYFYFLPELKFVEII